MNKPVFVRIYFNGVFQSVKQFTQEQIVIGRSTESHIHLADEGVSQIHAVIDSRDAGFYISDLGSQAGTYKNGESIIDAPLSSGDELQFGPYRLEFFIGVPKPTQAPSKMKAEAVKPEKVAEDADEKKKVVPPLPIEPRELKEETVPKKETAPKEETVPKKDSTPGSDRVVQEPVDLKKAVPFDSKAKVGLPLNVIGPDMKNSRGTIVEVTIVWKDRTLGTYHYNEKRPVTIGSDPKCDISIPVPGANFKQFQLLNLVEDSVQVFLSPEMTGEHYKGEATSSLADLRRRQQIGQSSSGGQFIALSQGESLRLSFQGDLFTIFVRFVKEVPPPILGPLFDLTASESTAVLMSIVISAIFGLYMFLYTPKPIEDQMELEEKLRKATITFKVPKKIVKVSEVAPPQEKKIVKVEEKVERTTTKPNPGKAAELAPVRKPKKANVASSTIKQGGSINTGKPAANVQSETRDVTKLGLLSTLGGKGAQKELSKAYSGTGELLGDANKATGNSGSADSRAGESLGGRLKNVGAGGSGSQTYGISGVGTQGKGTGTFGGGSGGIGKKGRVDLNIGESEAEFMGTIDKEAIRRVIRENIKLFENCYNQALRRNSGAYGKIAIKWYIEERGRATQASVNSNSVGDKPMGECLTRVIRSLTFPEPPPDQIAEVVYPFVFAAQ